MPRKSEQLLLQKCTDLMAAYRRIADSCTTQKQAWERTVDSPAPRYYITHFQAYQRMLQFYKKDPAIQSLPLLQRRQFEALYETCLRMSQQKEYVGMSLYQLTQFAILQPAPSFFVSPKSVPRYFQIAKQYENDKHRRFLHFYRDEYLKNKNKKNGK